MASQDTVMHKLTINTEFLIERKEQAEYVQKLYEDLHALLDVASSRQESKLISLVEKVT